MQFNVSCELAYAVRFPSTLILNIHAQHGQWQMILDERFTVEPAMPFTEFSLEGSDSRFIRLETGPHKTVTLSYSATVDVDYQTYGATTVEPIPVAELNTSTIPYLFPSRYCQSDRLGRLAWDLFGPIENPHEKVVARSRPICDSG